MLTLQLSSQKAAQESRLSDTCKLAHAILIARVPFNTEVDPQRAVDELSYNKHGLINVAF